MLLSHRHHDSRTRKITPRATVKVASKKNQRLERERVPRFAPAAARRLPSTVAECMAHGWYDQAPPALVAVEDALHRGRYGVDTDSHAAPTTQVTGKFGC